MTLKPGRTRKVNFGADLLSFLDEVGERVEDQVSHLPPEVLNACAPNSVLSVGRLVLHMVASEVKVLGPVVPGLDRAPYLSLLEPGLLTEESRAPGDLSRAPAVLRDHLSYRRRCAEACRRPGFEDEVLDHPRFGTNGAALRHMVWHWSYHSGQIGLLTLEAGWDYRWA